MSLRSLKQYIECLKFSGIDFVTGRFQELRLNQTNTILEKKKESSVTKTEDFSVQTTILCPVKEIKEADTLLPDEKGIAYLKINYAGCKNCLLHKTRIKFVYGEGSDKAKALIIGEGPGADENITGRPFVGEAGKLLTKMLAAININREEVYITNIVKCRPPGNRVPSPEEAAACMPYLEQQIRVIKPKVILLLGKTAINNILKTDDRMEVLRQNQPFTYQGIPVWLTYHPSALLRRPEWKKDAWVDLQKFRDFYNNLKG